MMQMMKANEENPVRAGTVHLDMCCTVAPVLFSRDRIESLHIYIFRFSIMWKK